MESYLGKMPLKLGTYSIWVHECKCINAKLCCVVSWDKNRIYNSIETIIKGLPDNLEIWHTNCVHSIHDYCSFQKLLGFKVSKIIKSIRKLGRTYTYLLVILECRCLLELHKFIITLVKLECVIDLKNVELLYLTQIWYWPCLDHRPCLWRELQQSHSLQCHCAQKEGLFCTENKSKNKMINIWLTHKYIMWKIHWASKETYHFFRATHIKIQSMKMNHNGA